MLTFAFQLDFPYRSIMTYVILPKAMMTLQHIFFLPIFSISIIGIFFRNIAILHLAIFLIFQKLTNNAFANIFGIFEKQGFLFEKVFKLTNTADNDNCQN